jgi:hypothetical protein
VRGRLRLSEHLSAWIIATRGGESAAVIGSQIRPLDDWRWPLGVTQAQSSTRQSSQPCPHTQTTGTGGLKHLGRTRWQRLCKSG